MFPKLYLYGMLLTALGSYALGLFVASKKSKYSLHRIWFYFCFSVGTWSLGYAFTMLPDISKNSALICSRISHASGALIPAFFLHYIFIWLNIKSKHRFILYLSYSISATIAFLSLSSFIVIDLTQKMVFKYYPVGKIGYFLYILNFVFWVILAHYFMIKSYKIMTAHMRNQLKYFLFGTISGYFGGATCFPLIFNIKILPYPSVLIIVYILTTTYAIVRYRLMDISVAITRTSIFVLVYTLVIGVPFAVSIWSKSWLIAKLGPNWWTMPLTLMAVLATVGPFIYIYLEKRAEEALLKEQRRYQSTLKQASLGMTRIRDLRRLLDLIAHIVTKTVKISYVAVYLHDKHTDEYVLQLSRDKGRVPVQRITGDNPLVAWIISKREPLIYDEVKRQMEDAKDLNYQQIEENMRILTATVIIPSFLEDKFMGFFVLGDKMSGQIFTPDDLSVFQVLATQAALAIENAQFYEETKEMQDQISQAEKMATIGTMADGLSHQINNRFYALSLIAGDTIDTIKITDTSKCTPEIKEMIGEINRALQRIQSNVIQGGEVVQGMLKYSRRGEEGFEALELNKVLDNTLEMVQFKVKLSEIDIIRDFDHIPKIKGNMTQLEEVFFNFIDNANDAISERRTTLKEPNYRGKITVSAKPKSEEILEIVIQDNGMGVNSEVMKKVFTPFFTTKTSSRTKGTGLGLYVIRRIITDTHKGKISFESEHKVGTRFIVELPVAKA